MGTEENWPSKFLAVSNWMAEFEAVSFVPVGFREIGRIAPLENRRA
jgi:hypothetical protein